MKLASSFVIFNRMHICYDPDFIKSQYTYGVFVLYGYVDKLAMLCLYVNPIMQQKW